MKPFPVNKLNVCITQAISNIVSIDIYNGIEDGLDPEIHIVDLEGGPIQDAVKISEIPATLSPKYKRKVTVSAGLYADLMDYL